VSGGALAIAAGATVAALAGLTFVSIAPACTIWGPVIARGPSDSRGVALTFDDGPTPGTTERVLDELAKADARATFFVIGVNAERHPDLLRRIHNEGHAIANHSWHHSHFCAMGMTKYWEREIRRTDELIHSIIGQTPTMFRPPMGVKTWHTTAAVRRQGSTLVTWSRRAVDGIPTTSQRILERFSPAAGGDILLLHDGVEPYAPHHDRDATIAAIRPLVASLREKKLMPIRLDELLKIPPYRRATAT
jgi:peptidoglycan/xylan/chitin deacetylase (PgdA/CDA1 family)